MIELQAAGMNTDHIPPFLFGVLCGAWAALAAMDWAFKRRLKRQEALIAKLTDDLSTTKPSVAASVPQPLTVTSVGPWWADPSGTRLELADTGFYISFHPSEPRRVHQGHTPEHLCIASGPYLNDMKKHMEACAAERAEFTPQGGGWKP